MLRTRGAFRRQGQQRKRNLSARGIIGVHDKSRVGLSTNGFALHLVPRTDEYRRAPEVHGRADSHMTVGTDFDYDFNCCLICCYDCNFNFRCIELGWWCNFSIALFGVLFIAIVGLVIDSIFFSPRLWLSNGC